MTIELMAIICDKVFAMYTIMSIMLKYWIRNASNVLRKCIYYNWLCFEIIFTAILNSNNVMWSMAEASANHFIVYGTKA